MAVNEQSLRYTALDIRDELVVSAAIGKQAMEMAQSPPEEDEFTVIRKLPNEDRKLVDLFLSKTHCNVEI